MRARLLLLLLALVEGVIPSTHWVVTETGKIQAQVSTARSATVYWWWFDQDQRFLGFKIIKISIIQGG